MSQSLSKGILIIFLANIINLGFSIATNFLLPKYLPIDSYAMIKTYQLYAGYIGLMHLGFIDGMYLFMGGKAFDKISCEDIKEEISTLFSFQTIIMSLVIILSLLIKNKILLFTGLSILPVNMLTYFRYLYQSTGEYKLYGRIMNSLTILTCTINIILLFIINLKSAFGYILSYVFLNYIIFIGTSIYMSKKLNNNLIIFNFSPKCFKKNILAGYSLTLGNIAFSLLICMSQWFVSFFLTTSDFAYYSFSITLVNFINIAVTPISITLYNFFCKQTSKEEIIYIRNLIIIFSCLLMSLAFCAQFILETFITNYLESSKIMYILFAAQMFSIINTSVYVNLYKAQKKQNIYMNRLIATLIISVFLDILITLTCKTKENYAIGTLAFSIIWFVLSCLDFKSISLKSKEIVYMIICLSAFIYCGLVFKSYYGLCIYLLTFSILTSILFKQPINRLFIKIKSKK